MSSIHLQKHIVMFLETVGKFFGTFAVCNGEKSGKKQKRTVGKIVASFSSSIPISWNIGIVLSQ